MSVLRADLHWTRPRLRDENANAETDGWSARRLRRHFDPRRAQDPDAVDRDEGVQVAAARLGRPLLLPRHKCNQIIIYIYDREPVNKLCNRSQHQNFCADVYFHKNVCALFQCGERVRTKLASKNFSDHRDGFLSFCICIYNSLRHTLLSLEISVFGHIWQKIYL